MQTELEFPRSNAPVVSQAEIDSVISFLTGRNWTKASEITAAIGIDDRRIRVIAEQSEGAILSGPGCPGYKLLTCAAQLREVDEAAGRLESQGRRMIARAYSIRRRAHRLIA
jgi:hypothetical protein